MSVGAFRKRVLATGLALSMCAFGAACSSSGGGSSNPSSPDTAGGAKISSTKLPKATIGIIPLTGAGSEVLQQSIAGLKAGAKLLGWSTEEIDPAGSGQKAQAAMSTFIAKKVTAIFTMAIDVPLLGTQLSAAKAAGIPVIDVNNGVDPATASQYSAVIAPSETEWGKVLGNYMTKSLTPGPVIKVVNAPYTSRRMADVSQQIAAPKGFTTLKTEVTDITNIVPSYQAVTREGLLAYPKTKYMVAPGDFAPGIMEPVLKAINRTDVTLLTRYDDQPTVALMKSGAKLVVVATDLYLPAFIALDQLAAFLVNKTPVHSVETGYPFKVLTTATIGSYPKSGYLYPLSAELTKYKAKWAKEYGA